ncbi:MAG: hypothetical protein HY794_16735 [Desulfarculus sp.]|nr:hypothetical protein [Desulfarculus sp.]
MRPPKSRIKAATGYDPEPALEVCGWCAHVQAASSGKLWCLRDPGRPFRVNRYGRCDHCAPAEWDMAAAGGDR